MDVMEGARGEASDSVIPGRKRRIVPKPLPVLSPAQLAAHIKTLEQQMYQHARDLEFEQAAQIRDQIRQLRLTALEGV